jgi:diphthamide biosynthesis methyltransferase
MVESASDDILNDAQNVDVAFLVVGDPFGYVSSHSLPMQQMLTRLVEQLHIPTLSYAHAH